MSKTFVENEMPLEEYLGWCQYFRQRPPGWEADRRTYLIISAFGVKENPEAIFPSLKQMKEQESKDPLGFFKQMAAQSNDWNPEV
jgi:hypothetical protein